MATDFEIYAKCEHCGEDKLIAMFDNRKDAAAYAKAQKAERPGYVLRVVAES